MLDSSSILFDSSIYDIDMHPFLVIGEKKYLSPFQMKDLLSELLIKDFLINGKELPPSQLSSQEKIYNKVTQELANEPRRYQGQLLCQGRLCSNSPFSLLPQEIITYIFVIECRLPFMSYSQLCFKPLLSSIELKIQAIIKQSNEGADEAVPQTGEDASFWSKNCSIQ
jgi:hypothetical protein